MDDLTAFITGRLDEDEANANEVHLPRGCACIDREGDFVPRWCDCGYPARALREVAAKRAMVAEHAITDWTAYGDHMCTRCSREREDAREDDDQCSWLTWPCPTIRAIASVYSDHPDYRAEWAPSAT